MKVAYGPFNKLLRNPDELFEKSDWGTEAAARHHAMKLSDADRVEIVAYLFYRKFCPLSKAKATDALFACLLKSGDTKLALYLLQLSVDEQAGKYGHPLLHMAIKADWESGVRFLLSNGVDPNVAHKNNGVTVLMYASELGKEKFVTIFIEAGANLDLQDYRGFTALIHAVDKGNEDIVKILLLAGADKTLRNDAHMNALDIAYALGPRRGGQIIKLLKSDTAASYDWTQAGVPKWF
ncbi:MAG: hypothetical protein Q9216_002035 [Gyalolechia sp. 2 TL-2023]